MNKELNNDGHMQYWQTENSIAINTLMLFSFLFLIYFHALILSVIAGLKALFHNFEKF